MSLSIEHVLSSPDHLLERYALAEDPACPPHVQRLLAADPDLHVRSYLARNSSLLPDLCALLTWDPEYHVRACLAGNPSCADPSLHLLLAADEASAVTLLLSKNPSLSLDEHFPALFVYHHFPFSLPALLSRPDSPPGPDFYPLAKRWKGSIASLASFLSLLDAESGAIQEIFWALLPSSPSSPEDLLSLARSL